MRWAASDCPRVKPSGLFAGGRAAGVGDVGCDRAEGRPTRRSRAARRRGRRSRTPRRGRRSGGGRVHALGVACGDRDPCALRRQPRRDRRPIPREPPVTSSATRPASPRSISGPLGRRDARAALPGGRTTARAARGRRAPTHALPPAPRRGREPRQSGAGEHGGRRQPKRDPPRAARTPPQTGGAGDRSVVLEERAWQGGVSATAAAASDSAPISAARDTHGRIHPCRA